MKYDRPKYSFEPLPEGSYEIKSHGKLLPADGFGQLRLEIGIAQRFPSQNPVKLQRKIIGIADLVAFPIGRFFNGKKPSGDIDCILKTKNGSIAYSGRFIDHEGDMYTEVTLRNASVYTQSPTKPFDAHTREHFNPPSSLVDPATECVLLHSADRDECIYVPCTEVIRYMYGASSEFLKSVVQGSIGTHSSALRSIFNREESVAESKRRNRLYVHARRNLEEAEAILAASLVSDEQLWSMTQRVWSEAAADGLKHQGAHLKVNFLGIRITKIRLLCKRMTFLPKFLMSEKAEHVANRSIYRLFAIRILDLEITKPARRIVVGVPRLTFNPKLPGGPRMRPTEDQAPDHVFLCHENEPGLGGASPIVLPDATLTSWASARTQVIIEETTYAVGETGGKLIQIGPTTASPKGSTSDPGFGQQRVSHVNMVAPVSGQNAAMPFSEQRPLSRRLLTIAAAVQDVAERHHLQATEISTGGIRALQTPPACIEFPTEYPTKHRMKSLPWSYLNEEDDIRRRAFVGCLGYFGKKAAIIETEIIKEDVQTQSHDDGATTLILRLDNDEELSIEMVEYLLMELSRKRGCWKRVEHIPGTFVTLNHYGMRSSTQGMINAIEKSLIEIGLLSSCSP